MYDVTKLLPKEQFNNLIKHLPTPKQKRRGRKRCNKKALVSGILQVLVLGIPWNKIFDCGCSSSSCFRYFRELQRRGIFKKEFLGLSRLKTDITECAVDTDSTSSFRFRRGVGWDGRHRKYGTKISLLGDKKGLPADVEIDNAKRSDPSFLDQHIKNTAGRRKNILNLDKIYVSLERRRKYKKKGIYINMKTRKGDYTRKKGPKFKLKEEKYKVRFLVEKVFAWIENFRRCKYRVDYKLSSYKGFVYLALLIILIRS